MSDASQKKLRQMLEMLIMLTNKYGRSKASLAEYFSISIKTVERYLETYREVGFIIDKLDADFFRINKENSEYKDLSELLHFSEDESEILTKAIDSIDTTTELKEQLKKKLYSVYNFDRVATPLAKKHNRNIIEIISEAIEAKKQVILLNYSSANSQNIRDRLVEPFNFTHNFTAVWAYECDTMTNKTFKIDRISKIQIQESSYCFEEKHKKNELDVFRMSSNHKIEIKLIMTIKAYNLLIEEFPRAEKFTKKIKNSKYEFLTTIADMKGVGRFIMGLPEDVEIAFPQELKNYVVSIMRKGIENFE